MFNCIHYLQFYTIPIQLGTLHQKITHKSNKVYLFIFFMYIAFRTKLLQTYYNV